MPPEMEAICVCEPTRNTMSHENTSTTMVRIAVAPHGFDVAGLRRIFLKLFPQPVDVHGDGGFVAAAFPKQIIP